MGRTFFSTLLFSWPMDAFLYVIALERTEDRGWRNIEMENGIDDKYMDMLIKTY